MSLYNAILGAAAHIERHPADFDFHSTDRPIPCGTPGCAIGWIAYYSGFEDNMVEFCLQHEFSDTHFYEAMDSLVGESQRDANGKKVMWGPWRVDPKLCARGMRLYAAKYHAPELVEQTVVSEELPS